MDIRSGIRRGRRVPLEVAIPGALRKNRAQLGSPDGPVGDFIRLIKLKRHYVDGENELPAVEWVDKA